MKYIFGVVLIYLHIIIQECLCKKYTIERNVSAFCCYRIPEILLEIFILDTAGLHIFLFSGHMPEF